MADISRITESLYMGSASFEWDEVWGEFDVVISLISPGPWGKPPKRNHQAWLVYAMDDDEFLPPDGDLDLLVDYATAKVRQGKNVLVHCGAGLNRSGLVSTLVLLRLRPEMSGREAVQFVRKMRGPLALCNPWFEKWIYEAFPERDQAAKKLQ